MNQLENDRLKRHAGLMREIIDRSEVWVLVPDAMGWKSVRLVES